MNTAAADWAGQAAIFSADETVPSLLAEEEMGRGAAPSAGALPPATRVAAAAGQAPLTLLILVVCRLKTRSLARFAATCSDLYLDKPAADEPRPMTTVEDALRLRAKARCHVSSDRLPEGFSSWA